MQYREISYANEEEWLNIRKKGIGGSDAGAIMGKNKYKNIIDVWKDKTGRAKNNFTSPAAQRGKNLEKNIFNSYKEDHPDKKILEVNKMYVHPKYDFIRANLDGEIIYQDKKGIGGSDAGAIMGKNKYKNIIDVWKDKTGRVQNNFTSPAAQRGKNLEKNIFNSYKEDNPDKNIL